jgi:hypothetical protein
LIDFTDEDQCILDGFKERLPRHLYRYIRISGERFVWFHDLAIQSTMYFPPFHELNDPFEGKVQLDFAATPEEIRAFWTRWLSDQGLLLDDAAKAGIEAHVGGANDPAHHASLSGAVATDLSEYGVASFTESEDDAQMWANYAEGHRGVCLRFNTVALFLPARDGFTPPVPIAYVPELPRLAFYRNSWFQRTLALVATKTKNWAYEKEWRIIHEAAHGGAKINPLALDAVICGREMPEGDRGRVERIRILLDDRVKLLRA